MANIHTSTLLTSILLAHLFNRKDYGQNLNYIQAFLQIVNEQNLLRTRL